MNDVGKLQKSQSHRLRATAVFQLKSVSVGETLGELSPGMLDLRPHLNFERQRS